MFFDVVAASAHALIDELVTRCCLGRAAKQCCTKLLYGTRKAPRLWQRILREVRVDADWKASVIFELMYTLSDLRGTLVCWRDDLLAEADEKDLDAVEAHLMKRLEEDMLARIGGKSSGEAGFLRRVLRYDAVTESFF